ncbi:hypothetical protein GFS31_00530 [Leptolyngbya sp. BL0902]|uniref:hypothetical protein n=1 Tax=Leptolyngbya sp. BL0902 TaxID=1115757 RepID=UPI0018E7059E|nr:hypothetical protein [Leptolyngbya sp. BL0902]QQE63388.1 hypothetical protein GFS31_00530 [Leptolyngbya sp. BL0902]
MDSLPSSLPDYEQRLLTALAYFLGRDSEAQARACLCMYLRQAEPRIMAQVNYYAHRFSQATGQPTSGYELLDLLSQSPEVVRQALPGLGQVHAADTADVFTPAEGPGFPSVLA